MTLANFLRFFVGPIFDLVNGSEPVNPPPRFVLLSNSLLHECDDNDRTGLAGKLSLRVDMAEEFSNPNTLLVVRHELR